MPELTGPSWPDCVNQQRVCRDSIYKKMDDQHGVIKGALERIERKLAKEEGAKEERAVAAREARAEMETAENSPVKRFRMPTVGEVVRVGIVIGALAAGTIGGCEGARLASKEAPAPAPVKANP